MASPKRWCSRPGGGGRSGPSCSRRRRTSRGSRRPTDVVLAVTSALVVVIAGVASRLLTELEQAVSGVVADVPGFFDAAVAIDVLGAGGVGDRGPRRRPRPRPPGACA